MSTYPYSPTFNPPAPVCQVTLIARLTNKQIELQALLDTGADGTIIPIHHLRTIGARRAFEAKLHSQWGERRSVFLYLVDLRIGDVALPGIYVVGDEVGQENVLGRNVLNRLKLLLDGPALSTQFLR